MSPRVACSAGGVVARKEDPGGEAGSAPCCGRGGGAAAGSVPGQGRRVREQQGDGLGASSGASRKCFWRRQSHCCGRSQGGRLRWKHGHDGMNNHRRVALAVTDEVACRSQRGQASDSLYSVVPRVAATGCRAHATHMGIRHDLAAKCPISHKSRPSPLKCPACMCQQPSSRSAPPSSCSFCASFFVWPGDSSCCTMPRSFMSLPRPHAAHEYRMEVSRGVSTLRFSAHQPGVRTPLLLQLGSTCSWLLRLCACAVVAAG